MELEPVVGAVVELGEKLGLAMPYTRTVYAATKMLDSNLAVVRNLTAAARDLKVTTKL